MNESIMITKDILNEVVPSNLIPKRVTSASSLYVYVKNNEQEGLLLYNMNEAWNLWFPYNIINNHFMSDVTFTEGITYGELIEKFEELFNKAEETHSKNDRIQELSDGFKELNKLSEVKIGSELKPIYEIKYSKSANVYSMYKHEAFILESVDDANKLLEETTYPSIILPIDKLDKTFDGVKAVGNIKEAMLVNKDLVINNAIEIK